jgi:hypothetical protein
MPDLCKNGACNFVYPILNTECAGNSLSSINFNFLNLNAEMCFIENMMQTSWNPAFNTFAASSALWLQAATIVQTTSSCWNNTSNTVSEMSGFWLSPITIVYPYPWNGGTDANVLLAWLNEVLPPKQGNCINYIVGQELFLFSPEYGAINRVASQAGGQGLRNVCLGYTCDCIGAGTYRGRACTTVDCGSYSVTLSLPDSFINDIKGYKFQVNNSFQWVSVNTLF